MILEFERLFSPMEVNLNEEEERIMRTIIEAGSIRDYEIKDTAITRKLYGEGLIQYVDSLLGGKWVLSSSIDIKGWKEPDCGKRNI